VDQGSRPLCGVAFAPGGSIEPVAELDFAGIISLLWPELEPPQEFPGGFLDRSPAAEPLETLIVVE